MAKAAAVTDWSEHSHRDLKASALAILKEMRDRENDYRGVRTAFGDDVTEVTELKLEAAE